MSEIIEQSFHFLISGPDWLYISLMYIFTIASVLFLLSAYADRRRVVKKEKLKATMAKMEAEEQKKLLEKEKKELQKKEYTLRFYPIKYNDVDEHDECDVSDTPEGLKLALEMAIYNHKGILELVRTNTGELTLMIDLNQYRWIDVTPKSEVVKKEEEQPQDIH